MMRKRGIPSLIVIAAGLVLAVWMTPAEAQLGYRIRPIYLHAASIWIAILSYVLAGILALAALWRRRWLGLALTLDLVSTVFLLTSAVFSLYSMKVAWGGVFLAEPRMQAMLKVLALAVAVHAVTLLILRAAPPSALLVAGKSALALWWQFSAGLVLHPDRPILKADPRMQLAFLLVFAATAALAAWLAVAVHRRLWRSERRSTGFTAARRTIVG